MMPTITTQFLPVYSRVVVAFSEYCDGCPQILSISSFDDDGEYPCEIERISTRLKTAANAMVAINHPDNFTTGRY